MVAFCAPTRDADSLGVVALGLAAHRLVVSVPVDRGRSCDSSEDCEAPVIEWGVQCDHPRCTARVYATALTDRQAREIALTRAAEEGWLIEHDRFIRPREDLCPKHRGDR